MPQPKPATAGPTAIPAGELHPSRGAIGNHADGGVTAQSPPGDALRTDRTSSGVLVPPAPPRTESPQGLQIEGICGFAIAAFTFLVNAIVYNAPKRYGQMMSVIAFLLVIISGFVVNHYMRTGGPGLVELLSRWTPIVINIVLGCIYGGSAISFVVSRRRLASRQAENERRADEAIAQAKKSADEEVAQAKKSADEAIARATGIVNAGAIARTNGTSREQVRGLIVARSILIRPHEDQHGISSDDYVCECEMSLFRFAENVLPPPEFRLTNSGGSLEP